MGGGDDFFLTFFAGREEVREEQESEEQAYLDVARLSTFVSAASPSVQHWNRYLIACKGCEDDEDHRRNGATNCLRRV
jgi:hypothetical protein